LKLVHGLAGIRTGQRRLAYGLSWEAHNSHTSRGPHNTLGIGYRYRIIAMANDDEYDLNVHAGTRQSFFNFSNFELQMERLAVWQTGCSVCFLVD